MNMATITIDNSQSMTNFEFEAIPGDDDFEIDSSSWELELHTPEGGDQLHLKC